MRGSNAFYERSLLCFVQNESVYRSTRREFFHSICGDNNGMRLNIYSFEYIYIFYTSHSCLITYINSVRESRRSFNSCYTSLLRVVCFPPVIPIKISILSFEIPRQHRTRVSRILKSNRPHTLSFSTKRQNFVPYLQVKHGTLINNVRIIQKNVDIFVFLRITSTRTCVFIYIYLRKRSFDLVTIRRIRNSKKLTRYIYACLF